MVGWTTVPLDVVVVVVSCPGLLQFCQELVVLLQLGHDLVYLDVVRGVLHLNREHEGGVAASTADAAAAVALQLRHFQDELLVALILNSPFCLQARNGRL